jgi:E3 ubiquitin-protein ligase MYCBP2
VILSLGNLSAAEPGREGETSFWVGVAALCYLGGLGDSSSIVVEFASLAAERVDLSSHEGSCRAKFLDESGFARLIVVGDLARLQASCEFREKGSLGVDLCRFCGVRLGAGNRAPLPAPSESLALVCNSEACLEARGASCRKLLVCGHACCGIADEKECLPCLQAGCSGHGQLKQDADSQCSICYTDTLAGAPSVLLKCGHVFHFACVRRQLMLRWNGPRITFGFLQCPLCKSMISHPLLADLTGPLLALRDDVVRKAVMRLKYEGLDKHPDLTAADSRFFRDPEGFALHRFAYYLCFKCQRPYFGGNYECAAAGNHDFNPSEFVCGGCAPSQAQDCPKHGRDYLEFKCRFCCSVAVWFCFGTTHFCEPCHNNHSVLCNRPKAELVQCACKPKDGRQLPEKIDGPCPLGVQHPPSGEEFALGCGLCRNIKDF